MRLPALRVIALVVACGAGLVAAAAGSISAAAAPGITLSPKTGPPTSTVTVSGTGLGAFKAVDIYFDTTDEALASTGADGSFPASRSASRARRCPARTSSPVSDGIRG